MATSEIGGPVTLWDANSGSAIKILATVDDIGRGIAGAADISFSPDGRTVAGTPKSGIALWDA